MALLDDVLQQLEDVSLKVMNIERERGSIPRALSPFYKAQRAAAQSHGRAWVSAPLYGGHLAICVDTRDPWKMGRIMVYCPVIHKINPETQILSESGLSWAAPCSPFGSIDDMGAVFIPPEGSVVVCLFSNGNRDSIYYIGTTPMPKKASPNTEGDFTPMRETHRRNPGRRNNDIENGIRDNLLPPWNNESYYGQDLNPVLAGAGGVLDVNVIATDTKNQLVFGNSEEQKLGPNNKYNTLGWRSSEIPHIYGIKTPEKHFIQFVDGAYDYKKAPHQLWGKRLVLQSSKGHLVMFKDDNQQTAEEIYNHPYWDSVHDRLAKQKGQLAFSKVGNRHSIELNHTGAQVQSLGGGRLIIDDKLKGNIKKDSNSNNWDASFPPPASQLEEGKRLYRTMIRLESHTEHRITLSDHHEEQEWRRSKRDGIFLSTACGQYIGMIDDTDEEKKGGENRQILIQSTAEHSLVMKDRKCSIQSPMVRSSGRYLGENQKSYRDNDVYDKPNSKADGKGSGEQVCVKLRSGFGHYLLFEDGPDQEKPTTQYLILSNSDKWEKNPKAYNYLRMNQVENDKLVHLYCAGKRLTTVEKGYIRNTTEDEILHVSEGSQTHIVDKGDMIDNILERNFKQVVLLGRYDLIVEKGQAVVYAGASTKHYCDQGVHEIYGGIKIDDFKKGKEAENTDFVLLSDGGPPPAGSRKAKYLRSN